MSRHKTPGRGGSAPAGDAPKVPTLIRLDPALKERARELVGSRGLSPRIEDLLREWVAAQSSRDP